MYFKRPSFRRGGTIGGGIMSGTDMGSRTGFQNPIINFLNKNIMGPNTQFRTMPSGPLTITQQPKRGIEEVLANTNIRGSVNTMPQTVEELYEKRGEKLKRSGNVLGEVFASKTFTDADGVERDRTTGKIVKNTVESSGIAEVLSEGAAGDQITKLTDEEKGAATDALLASIQEKKNKVEAGSEDSSITLDPMEEIKREKDFLNNLLKNEGLERGEAALVAAKAIGTEGSFKDKLDAAVNMALPIVRKRNKEDKAVTLMAYKAFKDKEKEEAKAGKDTPGIKELKYQASLLVGSDDPRYKGKSQEEIMKIVVADKFKNTDELGRKKILEDSAATVKEDFEDVLDSKKTLETYIKTKYTDKGKEVDATDKKLIRLQEDLAENVAAFKLLADYAEFADVFPTFANAFKKLNLAEGGRVKRALGTPDTGSGEQIITTEAQTVGAETAEKPVMKLTYAQLRDRLPAEITDDVVQLLANSEEALQEFAYIETQNDVNAFNLKYGVNLIIPPAPQTA
tara:strand:- start:513 stop:2045 length:1533 start_codon:yes stop_codon:yes gene_type:complete